MRHPPENNALHGIVAVYESNQTHSQQVTAYLHKDYNNLWLVRKPTRNESEFHCLFACFK